MTVTDCLTQGSSVSAEWLGWVMSQVPQSSQPRHTCSLYPCAGLRTSLTRPEETPGTGVLSLSASQGLQ